MRQRQALRSRATGGAVVGFMVLVLAVAGCSATPADEVSPSPSASAPSGNAVMYEAAHQMGRCMQDRGWDVEVTDTGGWGIEAAIPNDQKSAYDTALAECTQQLGLDDIQMTPELAQFNYDNTVRVIECLDDAGYSTPDGPPQGSYVQALVDNPDSVPWDPYELVPADELQEAILSCPQ